MESKVKYVVWNKQDRKGKFIFCSCTQEHWCNTLKQAKQEIVFRDPIGEDFTETVPKYIYENVEDFVIYKMILERVEI